MGWYSQGTQVIDFVENPDGTVRFAEAGYFIPENANEWVSARLQDRAEPRRHDHLLRRHRRLQPRRGRPQRDRRLQGDPAAGAEGGRRRDGGRRRRRRRPALRAGDPRHASGRPAARQHRRRPDQRPRRQRPDQGPRRRRLRQRRRRRRHGQRRHRRDKVKGGRGADKLKGNGGDDKLTDRSGGRDRLGGGGGRRPSCAPTAAAATSSAAAAGATGRSSTRDDRVRGCERVKRALSQRRRRRSGSSGCPGFEAGRPAAPA